MAWYSILPSHLTTYETWIIRIFLCLAIVNIAPWIIAILYDFLYYVGRQIWHEIPLIGGRAQGAQRPRAPSLRDRARRMSFRDLVTGGGPGREREGDELASSSEVGRGGEEKRHRRDLSKESISEEKEEEESPGRDGT